jgi:hypothetical protein
MGLVMQYDIEAIKRAFWQTFHNQGEIYFSHRDGNTAFYWEEFCDFLRMATVHCQGPLEDILKDQEKLDEANKRMNND